MTEKRIFQLPIGPGLYTEQTERGAVGRWYTADKVRFRKGLAEKIGGWTRLDPQFLGVCRRLKDWSSLDAKRWAAVATDVKLYLWQSGILYDITPLRDSGTLTDPFDTIMSSDIVTVNHTNHGTAVGDYVSFNGASGVGGIAVDGEYIVASLVNIDAYTIQDDETASSTVNGGGGATNYEYDITAGASSAIVATGYGTGPYGREGYGNARTGSTLILGIRTWALDTWGEDLLASHVKGKIYWWDRSKGTGSRAEALGGDAPRTNQYMIVSQRDRHVIALGAFDHFNQVNDPLLIRWSSTEDLNDWVPTSTNTSGDLRLYSGSKIITGVRSRLETVVFTDVSVHTLPFIGGFGVFGLNIVGENVSILGANCAVAIDHRVLFMAESDFYIYDGIVKVLSCAVRNFVYDNLNTIQKEKVYGGLNREFNEVWWFYPSYDPEAWVQQDFSLGLPSGYSLANGSDEPETQFDDVIFQADFEGSNGATSYTEESNFAESGTFNVNAQLTTSSPLFDTSSAAFDGVTSSDITFAVDANNVAAWDGTGLYMTAEVGFRIDTLPAGGGQDKGIILTGSADKPILRVMVGWSGGVIMRVGFAGSQGITAFVPMTGVDYFLVVEADNTGGPGNCVERVWIGTVSGGTATLVDTNSGLTARDPTTMDRFIFIGRDDSSTSVLDGIVDHARVTVSDSPRYGTGSTINIPTTYATEAGGASADIGYTYGFNSGGYTEVTATADNNYEHDYFLTNDEPIITPLESEYAIELDVNPDIGSGSGRAGLCFLRTDLTGTLETDADDAQQLMAEIDFENNEITVWKKTAAGVAAPANQGGNTVSFTTITGTAIALGTKYIITVQFDTPTVTIWVDGNQAFQFDLDVTELTEFAAGTTGLHQTPGVTDDLYRFYNFAAGPLGVLTAADFDISPIEVNRYVAFNYEEGTWTTGMLARTAWADRSPLLEKPYAAGTDRYLYQHETGTDANGTAMAAFIESFDMEIPEAGEELMHIDQLIPDFLELEGSVDVYLTGKKYPGDLNRISKGPYQVAPGTRKLSTRMRARQVALRIESNNTGDKWRMGNWRGRAGAHGKRG